MDETLVEVRRLNRVLTQLLDDPHPGLFTWVMALSNTLEALGKLAGK